MTKKPFLATLWGKWRHLEPKCKTSSTQTKCGKQKLQALENWRPFLISDAILHQFNSILTDLWSKN
jgi:hypothetical protein